MLERNLESERALAFVARFLVVVERLVIARVEDRIVVELGRRDVPCPREQLRGALRVNNQRFGRHLQR